MEQVVKIIFILYKVLLWLTMILFKILVVKIKSYV